MARPTAVLYGIMVLCIWCASPAHAATWWEVIPTGLHGPGDYAIDPIGKATYVHRTTVHPYAMNYAVQDSGTWSDETIADSYSVGTWTPDLVYAPNEEPGVAHVYWTGNATACYTYRSAGAWHTECVSPGEGQGVSLAYGPGGHAAMAYLNTDSPTGTGWTIDYAERTDVDSWTVETVATAGYIASGHVTSMAFLPDTGEPAIGFVYGFDPADPSATWTAELRCAFRNNGSWHIERVDHSSTLVGLCNDMALHPLGSPALSYYDSTNDQLKFARRVGPDQWLTEVVDTDGDVGRFNSLAFLPDGRPAIAYADRTNHDLKYAVWADNGWTINTVAEGLDGHYCELIIGTNGQPSIMFTDSVDSVYLASLVPEPATLTLLCMGTFALIRRSTREVGRFAE